MKNPFVNLGYDMKAFIYFQDLSPAEIEVINLRLSLEFKRLEHNSQSQVESQQIIWNLLLFTISFILYVFNSSA